MIHLKTAKCLRISELTVFFCCMASFLAGFPGVENLEFSQSYPRNVSLGVAGWVISSAQPARTISASEITILVPSDLGSRVKAIERCTRCDTEHHSRFHIEAVSSPIYLI